MTSFSRAEDEVRTRDLQLGRLSLYQLSYFRIILLSFSEGGNFIKNFYFDGHLHISFGDRSGQGWIRTTELRRGQIYSLLPLATWLLAQLSHLSESNQRPTDYKSVALPAELKWQFQMPPLLIHI